MDEDDHNLHRLFGDERDEGRPHTELHGTLITSTPADTTVSGQHSPVQRQRQPSSTSAERRTLPSTSAAQSPGQLPGWLEDLPPFDPSHLIARFQQFLDDQARQEAGSHGLDGEDNPGDGNGFGEDNPGDGNGFGDGGEGRNEGQLINPEEKRRQCASHGQNPYFTTAHARKVAYAVCKGLSDLGMLYVQGQSRHVHRREERAGIIEAVMTWALEHGLALEYSSGNRTACVNGERCVAYMERLFRKKNRKKRTGFTIGEGMVLCEYIQNERGPVRYRDCGRTACERGFVCLFCAIYCVSQLGQPFITCQGCSALDPEKPGLKIKTRYIPFGFLYVIWDLKENRLEGTMPKSVRSIVASTDRARMTLALVKVLLDASCSPAKEVMDFLRDINSTAYEVG